MTARKYTAGVRKKAMLLSCVAENPLGVLSSRNIWMKKNQVSSTFVSDGDHALLFLESSARDVKIIWFIFYLRATVPDLHCIPRWKGLCYCPSWEQRQEPNPHGNNAHGCVSDCLWLWELGMALGDSRFRMGCYLLLSCSILYLVIFLSWDAWVFEEKYVSCIYVHFSPHYSWSTRLTTTSHPQCPSSSLLFLAFLLVLFSEGIWLEFISLWEHWETFGDNVLLSCYQGLAGLHSVCGGKSYATTDVHKFTSLTTQVWGTEVHSFYDI